MGENDFQEKLVENDYVQLSLFNTYEPPQTQKDPELEFIDDLHQELLALKTIKEKLQSLFVRGLSLEDESKFSQYALNTFHVFFDIYFSDEKISFYPYLLKKYKSFSAEYHLFSQLILYYLKTFVYDASDFNLLEEKELVKLEDFALADKTPHRSSYYKDIIIKIKTRRRTACQTLVTTLSDKKEKSVIHENLEKDKFESKLSILDGKENVKETLENFLDSVFLFPKYDETEPMETFKNKEATFCDKSGVIEEVEAFTLAMEYLARFVYSVSEYYLVLDPKILALENYLAKCENFPIFSANLCVAKSILLKRAGSRSTLNDLQLLRKVLKTR